MMSSTKRDREEGEDESAGAAPQSSSERSEKENASLVKRPRVSAESISLASFSVVNADCLRHIFAKADLSSALHLALTCRRLYYCWRESQKTVKEVELATSLQNYYEHKVLLSQKAIFHSNNSDSSLAAVEEEERSVKQRVFLPADGCLPTCLAKLSATFTSLRHLEVAAGLDKDSFGPLLTQLTSSSLPKLTTLKLYSVRSRGLLPDSPDYLWRPLAQLQLPLLQHLTLSLNYPFVDGKAAPTFTIPPIPILSQLTSFNFFAHLKLSTFNQIILQLIADSKLGLNHLTAGVGAQFGLSLLKESSLQGDDEEPLPLIPESLSFLTYFKVQIRCFNNATINRIVFDNLLTRLPHLAHLQELEVTFKWPGEEPTDYPSFLTALTSLAHLRELTIFCAESNWELGRVYRIRQWPQSSMPVLSSVRTLSLVYSTYIHTDIVRKFHLTHCFPELRLLKCHFRQPECSDCSYPLDPGLRLQPDLLRAERLLRHQRCGTALSQPVLELLQPEETTTVLLRRRVILRYSFETDHFSSLENLLAGKVADATSEPCF